MAAGKYCYRSKYLVVQVISLLIRLFKVLLSGLMALPKAKVHPAYYFSLVSELCKLSPATFGPAVGKAFRKIHDLVGEGLDVELVRRYGDWFAAHMSNFGFQWVWKEWSVYNFFLKGLTPMQVHTGFLT